MRISTIFRTGFPNCPLKNIYFYFMWNVFCLHVCKSIESMQCLCLWRPNMGIGPPRTAVTSGYELL